MRILDLSSKKRVGGAKYWDDEINQLYHPLGVLGQDSQDLVYTRDNLNTTKFVPILLKEWFYLLKKGGYLVIDYRPNKLCNFQRLEENMWWLWKMKYNIVYHGTAKQRDLRGLTGKRLLDFIKNVPSQIAPPKETGGYLRFICQKLENTKVPGDDINHWTFGIITKGERNDWLDEIIQSIHAQKIPHYEIIVCGAYFDRKEENFTYIPFREREFKPNGWKGWITKQKNLIAKRAKYENLCIIHDRIVFDRGWFTGMKKYGNCFELLCNKQILRGEKIRTGEWLTYGGNTLDSPYGISKLDYTDWDEYIYVSGQLAIWKKSVWEKSPWNETRYWGEEDIELSFRARDLGFLIRFNQYSSCTALAWRFGELPSKYYLSQGLLPKDMLLRRVLRKLNKLIFSIPILKKMFLPLVRKLVQSKIYKFLANH